MEMITTCLYELLEKNSFELIFKFIENNNLLIIDCFPEKEIKWFSYVDGLKKAKSFVKTHNPKHVLTVGRLLIDHGYYFHTLLIGVASKLKKLFKFDNSMFYLEQLAHYFQYVDVELAELFNKYKHLARIIENDSAM